MVTKWKNFPHIGTSPCSKITCFDRGLLAIKGPFGWGIRGPGHGASIPVSVEDEYLSSLYNCGDLGWLHG
jgi:hypothetical protein